VSHRANTIYESHSRCPTPWDCVCACPACLNARANYIQKQQRKIERHKKGSIWNANPKEPQP
jgi:hypothetical protein